MKVYVVSAHPDDMEIGCSGTLLRLRDEGAEITSIITVAPSAEVNAHRTKDIVEKELLDSYQCSGFGLSVLNTELHPNGRPNLVANNITMTELSHYMQPCDLMILPNPEDSHQDHSNTYQLAYPLARKYAKEIWTMTMVPYCHSHKTNSSNLFYDITEYWDQKKKLLTCYNSYLNKDRINDIHVSNKFWGQCRGTELAEAFTIVHKNA